MIIKIPILEGFLADAEDHTVAGRFSEFIVPEQLPSGHPGRTIVLDGQSSGTLRYRVIGDGAFTMVNFAPEMLRESPETCGRLADEAFDRFIAKSDA